MITVKAVRVALPNHPQNKVFTQFQHHKKQPSYHRVISFGINRAFSLTNNNTNIFYQISSTLLNSKINLQHATTYHQTFRFFHTTLAMHNRDKDLDGLLQKGTTLMQQQKFPEAYKIFDEIIEKNPTYDVKVYLFKAAGLLTEKKTEEVLKVVSLGRKHFPKDTKLLHIEGKTHFDSKKYTEALAVYNQFPIDTRDVMMLNMKGQCHYYLGKYKNAIECYNISISLKPEAFSYSNKADALMSLGNYKEALMCCEKAIVLNPALQATYRKKAMCYLKTGNTASALAAIDKALSLKPDEFVAMQVKGNILQFDFRFEELYSFASDCIALFPKVFFGYFQKGWAASHLGKYEVANQMLENAEKMMVLMGKSLTDQSLFDIVHILNGWNYMGLKEYARAIGCLRLSKLPMKEGLLADCHFELKDYSEALKHYKLAVEMKDQPPLLLSRLLPTSYNECLRTNLNVCEDHLKPRSSS